MKRVVVTRMTTTVETYEVDAADARDACNVVAAIRREAHYIADPSRHAEWVERVQHSYARRALEPVTTAVVLGEVQLKQGLSGPMCFRCDGARHGWMPMVLDDEGLCPVCADEVGT